MFNLPKSTVYGRRIPKQKFYDNLNVTAELKRHFVEQIKVIYWTNVLSPQSMNLASGSEVKEIEVFRIVLQKGDLDDGILRLMDRQIPYHILFLLERPDGWLQLRVGYKEANAAGNNAFRVRQEYRTTWLPPEDLELNLTALDMDALYESIVRQIAGEALQPGGSSETLGESVEREKQRQKLQKQIAALEAKIRREKQLNRQMEMNTELKRIRKELEGYVISCE